MDSDLEEIPVSESTFERLSKFKHEDQTWTEFIDDVIELMQNKERKKLRAEMDRVEAVDPVELTELEEL